jgi:hypothetical protein
MKLVLYLVMAWFFAMGVLNAIRGDSRHAGYCLLVVLLAALVLAWAGE